MRLVRGKLLLLRNVVFDSIHRNRALSDYRITNASTILLRQVLIACFYVLYNICIQVPW